MAAKPVKVVLEVILARGDGPPQDVDLVIERLIEEIDGMAVWVQDENHNAETDYKVSSVERAKG